MRVNCLWCGTWVCDGCGAKRYGANRFGIQYCPKKCGSFFFGHMEPIKHQNERKAVDHLETYHELLETGITLRHPLKVDSDE